MLHINMCATAHSDNDYCGRSACRHRPSAHPAFAILDARASCAGDAAVTDVGIANVKNFGQRCGTYRQAALLNSARAGVPPARLKRLSLSDYISHMY